MNHKRHINSSGKIVDIFDDLFPSSLRDHHLYYAFELSYTLGGTSSTAVIEQRHKTFFQSAFDTHKLNQFNFFNDYLNPIWKVIGHREVDRSWINVSSPLSTYYYHHDFVDVGHKTILYYFNQTWNRNWGGETLFANNQGECEIAVEYKPGRIVVFDSDMEHKPSAISMDASEFRFTFVSQLML